jgi:hypothetical protein
VALALEIDANILLHVDFEQAKDTAGRHLMGEVMTEEDEDAVEVPSGPV